MFAFEKEQLVICVKLEKIKEKCKKVLTLKI